MKKSVICLSIILILSLGLITVSCSTTSTKTTITTTTSTTTSIKTTTTASATTTAAAQPQYGGILKIVSNTGIVNIGDPGKMFGPPLNLIVDRVCIESLIDLASPNNFTPYLATAWDYNQDYTSLTLTLRKDVKFHDGTDFNAAAVKYNLEVAQKIQKDLKAVSSIDVVDDYTVRLNLSVYEPRLIMGLAGVAGRMFSPTALETLGEEAATHPVGTGPFKFVSSQRDVSLKFEKFADYWDKGKPYLDGIEFVFIADAVTRLMSFQSGAGQVLLEPDPKDAIDLSATGGYVINKCPSMLTGLVGDSAHPDTPFADIKVRQAISYAINSEAIVKSQGYGFWEATNQITVSKAAEYNPSVVGYPFNPQKATDLLAQAGFSEGFMTTISCQSSSSSIASSVQAFLKDVGINVTVDLGDAARFTEMQTKGWDNQLMFYSIGYSYGLDLGYSLSGSLAQTGNKYNGNTVYIPDDYQALLDKANIEPDSQKRVAMFKELNKMITDQYCIINPLYVTFALAAIKTPEVHDLDLATIANHVWHPANAWLSK